MSKKTSILYVDDEVNNLISFKALMRLKYDVYTAESGAEALEILKNHDIQILITDQRMPNMTGVQLLESIIHVYPEPMRILLTGYADLNAVIEAVNKGKIFHYLSKPWDEKELEETIQRALEIYNKRKEEKHHADKLAMSNEQFEFLLRQKLLS
jgi:response regulator RpfG family c-di-GMP phosphodiesterase